MPQAAHVAAPPSWFGGARYTPANAPGFDGVSVKPVAISETGCSRFAAYKLAAGKNPLKNVSGS